MVIISVIFPDSAGIAFMFYFCPSCVSGYAPQCAQLQLLFSALRDGAGASTDLAAGPPAAMPSNKAVPPLLTSLCYPTAVNPD